MSIRNKIGQILMMDFRYWGEDLNKKPSPFTKVDQTVCDLFKKYNLGGFILFKENIKDNSQTISLLRNLQNHAGFPLFFAIDQEGGKVSRLPQGTNGCGNMAISATNNSKNAYQISKILADELYSLGVNINFAPVIDVNSNKHNPIIGVRSYSDDPKIVTKYAKECIKGTSDANILNCVKHFPGHGDTTSDSHLGSVVLDKSLNELEKTELYPFRKLSKNYDMLMSAHISVPALDNTKYISTSTGKEIYLPATLSYKIITKLLKKDIGFEGLVISDAMDMKAIKDHFEQIQAVKLAILAGIDIVLMPVRIWNKNHIDKLEKLFLILEEECISNKTFAKAVDKAYYKIIKFKNDHLSQNDIFRTSLDQQIQLATNTVNSTKHQNAVLDIAKQSTTIVKNNGIIPYKLKNQDNILIIDSDSDRLKDFYDCLEQLINQKNILARIIIKKVSNHDLEKYIKIANVVILVSENLKQHNKKYSYLTSLASKKTINIAAISPYDINHINYIENYICIYGATCTDQTSNTKISLKINIAAALDNIFSDKIKLQSSLPVKIN